jgi:hypothetical protein
VLLLTTWCFPSIADLSTANVACAEAECIRLVDEDAKGWSRDPPEEANTKLCERNQTQHETLPRMNLGPGRRCLQRRAIC